MKNHRNKWKNILLNTHISFVSVSLEQQEKLHFLTWTVLTSILVESGWIKSCSIDIQTAYGEQHIWYH